MFQEVENYLNACGLFETLKAFRKEIKDKIEDCYDEMPSFQNNKSSLAQTYFANRAEINKVRLKVCCARKKLAASSKKFAQVKIKLDGVAEECCRHTLTNLTIIDVIEEKIHNSRSNEKRTPFNVSENKSATPDSESVCLDSTKAVNSSFHRENESRKEGIKEHNFTPDKSVEHGNPYSGLSCSNLSSGINIIPDQELKNVYPLTSDMSFASEDTHLKTDGIVEEYCHHTLTNLSLIDATEEKIQNSCSDEKGTPFTVSENKNATPDSKTACLDSTAAVNSSFHRKNESEKERFLEHNFTPDISLEHGNSYSRLSCSNLSSGINIIPDEELKNVYPLASEDSYLKADDVAKECCHHALTNLSLIDAIQEKVPNSFPDEKGTSFTVSEKKNVNSDSKSVCLDSAEAVNSSFHRENESGKKDFMSSNFTPDMSRKHGNPYSRFCCSNISSGINIIPDEELKNVYPLSSDISLALEDTCFKTGNKNKPIIYHAGVMFEENMSNIPYQKNLAKMNVSSCTKGLYESERGREHSTCCYESTCSCCSLLSCCEKNKSNIGVFNGGDCDLRIWCKEFLKKSLNYNDAESTASSASLYENTSLENSSEYSSDATLWDSDATLCGSDVTLCDWFSTADYEINRPQVHAVDHIFKESKTHLSDTTFSDSGCNSNDNICDLVSKTFQERKNSSQLSKAVFASENEKKSSVQEKLARSLKNLNNTSFSGTSRKICKSYDQLVSDRFMPDLYLPEEEKEMAHKIESPVTLNLNTPFWKDKVKEHGNSICSNDHTHVPKSADFSFASTIQSGSRSKMLRRRKTDEICRLREVMLPVSSSFSDKSNDKAKTRVVPGVKNRFSDPNVIFRKSQITSETHSGNRHSTSDTSRRIGQLYERDTKRLYNSNFEVTDKRDKFEPFDVPSYFDFEKSLTPLQSSSVIDMRVPEECQSDKLGSDFAEDTFQSSSVFGRKPVSEECMSENLSGDFSEDSLFPECSHLNRTVVISPKLDTVAKNPGSKRGTPDKAAQIGNPDEKFSSGKSSNNYINSSGTLQSDKPFLSYLGYEKLQLLSAIDTHVLEECKSDEMSSDFSTDSLLQEIFEPNKHFSNCSSMPAIGNSISKSVTPEDFCDDNHDYSYNEKFCSVNCPNSCNNSSLSSGKTLQGRLESIQNSNKCSRLPAISNRISKSATPEHSCNDINHDSCDYEKSRSVSCLNSCINSRSENAISDIFESEMSLIPIRPPTAVGKQVSEKCKSDKSSNVRPKDSQLPESLKSNKNSSRCSRFPAIDSRMCKSATVEKFYDFADNEEQKTLNNSSDSCLCKYTNNSCKLKNNEDVPKNLDLDKAVSSFRPSSVIAKPKSKVGESVKIVTNKQRGQPTSGNSKNSPFRGSFESNKIIRSRSTAFTTGAGIAKSVSAENFSVNIGPTYADNIHTGSHSFSNINNCLAVQSSKAGRQLPNCSK